MLAVSLLWGQRGGLERTRGHFCGTLPLRKKVKSNSVPLEKRSNHRSATVNKHDRPVKL